MTAGAAIAPNASPVVSKSGRHSSGGRCCLGRAQARLPRRARGRNSMRARAIAWRARRRRARCQRGLCARGRTRGGRRAGIASRCDCRAPACRPTSARRSLPLLLVRRARSNRDCSSRRMSPTARPGATGCARREFGKGGRDEPRPSRRSSRARSPRPRATRRGREPSGVSTTRSLLCAGYALGEFYARSAARVHV